MKPDARETEAVPGQAGCQLWAVSSKSRNARIRKKRCCHAGPWFALTIYNCPDCTGDHSLHGSAEVQKRNEVWHARHMGLCKTSRVDEYMAMPWQTVPGVQRQEKEAAGFVGCSAFACRTCLSSDRAVGQLHVLNSSIRAGVAAVMYQE